MYYFKIIFISFFIFFYNLNAKENDKVFIQLDWLHQFQFAGYYMAKEKGFFAEENLDVEINEFSDNSNIVEKVLNTKNTYAVGKSSLVIDRLEGKKILLLAAIYQTSPMVLISLKSNINKIKDLKNKSVMLTDDAKTAAAINSMIISQGINLNNINFQEHSFNIDDLINKKIHAMGCYLSNEPYYLKQKNIDFRIYNPSEYGFNFYGGIFFTSQKELEENPLRVKKIYKSILKGWQYAFNNIEETAKIIYEKYNTQQKNLNALIYEGKVLKKLAKFEEGELGNITLDKIEEIKRLYLLLGLTNSTINYKLNDLIYKPNKLSLNSKEINYLKNNTITLISNSNFPPFTINKHGKISGLEIDYWQLINKKINSINSIKIINNNKKANEVIKRNFSSAKFAFGKIDYDNEETSISYSIDRIKIAMATLIDKPYVSSVKELKNKQIAIIKGAIYAEEFKNKHPFLEYTEVKDINEGFELLQKNKVYGFISKLPALSYNITKNIIPNAKITGIFEDSYDLRLQINKENKILYNILNKAVSTISEQERKKIRDKYNSIIYEPQKDYSWIYKVIFFLLIVIIVIILNNRKLNKEIKKRKLAEKELFKIANFDGLTNIYNRRKIESILNLELNRAKRYKRALSLIFFDIDNFKLINDELGHSLEDEVLEKISILVKDTVRKTDFFGRWGGEEFIIILPETKKEQAKVVAYLLKEKIANFDFEIDRKVTCSFGVSQFEESDCADSLLTRADNAMYDVKRNGKNEVKVV
ncbi:hypothetical protein CP965_07485 [Halarcobacter mediterraneus]|uniref:diguanylate cyclase n=1 Tax=Halarcobacter mediterraneus TaxID=2023153 RepID=A0A4Q1AUX3_9BACT|nr:diguanylate cyclase [Halarcobacter mediterraneus]RXK12419.1 hypothetical protein CP965_07485 [Halarcobacter mediterraneus]